MFLGASPEPVLNAGGGRGAGKKHWRTFDFGKFRGGGKPPSVGSEQNKTNNEIGCIDKSSLPFGLDDNDYSQIIIFQCFKE